MEAYSEKRNGQARLLPLCFPMDGMLPALLAEFLEFQLSLYLSSVLMREIVRAFAFFANELEEIVLWHTPVTLRKGSHFGNRELLYSTATHSPSRFCS